MSNRIKGQMTAKKLERLASLEQMVNLIVRDMNTFQQHVNYLGNVLQATVNVLGNGAVTEEMKRLEAEKAGQAAGPAPVSVADQVIAEEAASADQSEERPGEPAQADAPNPEH